MEKQITTGRLAAASGLSRATLMHYERIGLLRSSRRSAAGYRLYSTGDVQRLQRIRIYRAAGMSLEDIRRLLDAGTGEAGALLEKRLEQTNHEIARLRDAQRLLLRLLSRQSAERLSFGRTRLLDKAQWSRMLAAAGLDETGMLRWHREFEREAPEAHQDFLESLGLDAGEVARIRTRARDTAPADLT